MSTQQNTESVIYTLPPSPEEIGLLVSQIVEQDEPRAVIIDLLQKSILVHPQSDEDFSEFTKESLMYLLSSEPIKMLEDPIEGIDELLQQQTEAQEYISLCLHPEQKQNINLPQTILWTKLVSLNSALLVVKESEQQRWKVFGATLPVHLHIDSDSI